MDTATPTRLKNTMAELETIVDRVGLQNVVECLSMICEEKADHIRVNWQDRRAGNRWARAAQFLTACANRIVKYGP